MSFFSALIQNLKFKWYRRQQKLHALGELNKPTHIDETVSFFFHKNIKIGKFCRVSSNSVLNGEGGITIGDGTMMGKSVVIFSSSHAYKNDPVLPFSYGDNLRPVTIGRGCWIGYGVMIYPGVTIGDGAIVAMGSVVVKSVPKGVIVGGNPAKEIGARENIEQIDEIIEKEQYFLSLMLKTSKSRRQNGMDVIKRKIVK